MAMKFDIFYRRPSGVLVRDDPANDSDDSSSSRPSSITTGIPAQLSFDKIIAGETREPCGLRDFMRYCLFVEHSAENLQFYLWLRDYTQRFYKAPQSERDLSPEWTLDDQAVALRRARADARAAARKLSASAKQTTVAPSIRHQKSLASSVTSITEAENPFHTPPGTPARTTRESISLSDIRFKSMRSAAGSITTRESREESLYSGFSAASIASESFTNAGLSKPFTIQPFRNEIDQVIAMYLADGAPREINLAGTEKKAVLIALQKTTHPSAFTGPEAVVKHTLLTQLHPNFVRWAIVNCSISRRIFCCTLASVLILFGFLISLLFTFSTFTRGWRALGGILILIGIAYLAVAAKGVCPVLYGLDHRHVPPWEAFLDDDYDPVADAFALLGGRNGEKEWAWTTWYKKRFLMRKIFDREVRVQEPAIRWIHHQIAMQALAIAVPITGAFLAIFMTVPNGNMF